MKRIQFAALIGTIALSTASLASGTGFKVVYNGGSIQKLKPGTTVTFRVEGRQLHVLNGDSEVATVPTYAVSGISYKDDTARREGGNVASAPEADVIVTWAEGQRRGGFALQCASTECPSMLAALQGVSNKQAVRLDGSAAQ